MSDKNLTKSNPQNLAENATLFERVREILDSSKRNVARSVNTEMVRAYWLIGKAIVEHEQEGEKRAEYGKDSVLEIWLGCVSFI
jgi:hypothetical protein